MVTIELAERGVSEVLPGSTVGSVADAGCPPQLVIGVTVDRPASTVDPALQGELCAGVLFLWAAADAARIISVARMLPAIFNFVLIDSALSGHSTCRKRGHDIRSERKRRENGYQNR